MRGQRFVATKRDLTDQMKQSLFREDLFYRIHVILIHLRPLRERKEDIDASVRHFLEKNIDNWGFQEDKTRLIKIHTCK